METVRAEFAIHAPSYDDTSPVVGDDDPMIGFLGDRLPAGARLLEYGIGTGRIAVPLVRAGYRVTGIDVSPDMLSMLAAKPESAEIEIVEGSFGDRHDLGEFDAVVCLFNSLYHAHDRRVQQAALRRAAEHLRPGGLLILANSSAITLVREYTDPNGIFVRKVAADHVWLTTGLLSPLEQILRISHLTVGVGGTRIHPVTLRYIWPEELRLMAEAAGLDVIEEYADWDGTPFTAQSREHIVVLRACDGRGER